jgi:hypothetical protein
VIDGSKTSILIGTLTTQPHGLHGKCDYFGNIERVPEAATNRLKSTYGRDEPTNYTGVDKKNLLRERDWVVQFEYDYDKQRVSGAIQWMTVDFVVPSEDDPFLAGLRAPWERATTGARTYRDTSCRSPVAERRRRRIDRP